MSSLDFAQTVSTALDTNPFLEIDESVEEDVWKHCETAEVPQEARFKS